MIYIDSWDAKNFVLFDSVQWKVQKGVTFILGRNRHRRDNSASNASGKSLLAGILPSLLFDTHSVVVKGGKSVQRQMYTTETQASVTLRSGSHSYRYAKNGSKTFLFKDGKDLSSRVARESLKKIFPLSEEEFFSTVYIDGRRYAGFLLGTAADRAAFISSLFRLDQIEETRQEIGKRLNDLKQKAARLDELKFSYKELRQKLHDAPMPTHIEEKEKKLAAVTARLSEARRALQQHSSYSVYLSIRKSIKSLPTPRFSSKELASNLKSRREYDAQLEAWKTYQKEAARVTEKLSQLGVIQDQLDSYPKALGIREKQRLLGVSSKPEACAKVLLPKHPIDLLEKSQEKLQNRRAYLRDSLINLNGLHGDCPTCKQGISNNHLKSIRSVLEQELSIVESRLKKIQSLIQQHKAFKKYQDYTVQLSKWKKFLELEAQIRDFPFDKVSKAYSLKTPTKINKPVEPEFTLDELEQEQQFAAKRKQLEQTLLSVSSEKPSLTKERAESILSKEPIAAKLQQELPLLKAQKMEYDRIVGDLREVKSRMLALKEELTDLPVYELLFKAYSGKGVNIRTTILGALAKKLEHNLNFYAKRVFEEGFKFTLQVEPNKFDVIVHRGRSKPSDIRYFSGAESRLFSIVFLLSILPMVPDSRRTNLLILDEPTANMDIGSLETFRDVLLPQLAKVVPSIVVITPNPEAVPQQARVFTVVKENGKSTLTKGIL